MQGPLHFLKAQSTFAINVLNRVGLSDCFDFLSPRTPEIGGIQGKRKVSSRQYDCQWWNSSQVVLANYPVLRGRVYTRPGPGSHDFHSSSLALEPETEHRHFIASSSISNSNFPGSCACAKAIPRISLPSVLNADQGNEYCFQSGPTVNGTIAGICPWFVSVCTATA